MTNKAKLPPIKRQLPTEKNTLPFNGNAVTGRSFSFSFSCFDRTHELFNLGDNTQDKVVSGKWFLDLLDCLKSVSNKSIVELERSMHDLHRVAWSNANATAPLNSGQCEYWQFRINKSKGRIIGFLISGVFYIVWLDPHHNLTNSDGYGGVNRYKKPLSVYETQELDIATYLETIKMLEDENAEYAELYDKQSGH